jgi:hypothetical protein
MELKELLAELAQLRANIAEADKIIAETKDAIAKTELGERLAEHEEARRWFGERAKVIVDDVHLQAVERYRATDNKAPAEGVKVAIYHEAKYDPAALLSWCRGNRVTYVLESLDAKRIAKNAEDLVSDGAPIKVVDVPRAQIAADLSNYLPSEEAPVIGEANAEDRLAQAEQIGEDELPL